VIRLIQIIQAAIWPAVLLAGLVLNSSAAIAQQADRSWPHEALVDVFRLHSDFKLDDQDRLEEILGSLRKDINDLLRLQEQKSAIHIVLFSNAREYTRYMQHYFPSIVQRRAIYLQDRGPGMLFTYWHEDIDIDLRHEAVHAILNQSRVQLPLWLDEGLAEYFEIPKDLRFSGNPYLKEIAARAQKGLVPSLMQLEKSTHMAEFTDANYRDSWAWIHYLLHRSEETQNLLVEYVSRHRKLTPQALLSRQLATIIVDPTSDFQEHFAKTAN
jgi:Protein of unknown function (DUF1570)